MLVLDMAIGEFFDVVAKWGDAPVLVLKDAEF